MLKRTISSTAAALLVIAALGGTADTAAAQPIGSGDVVCLDPSPPGDSAGCNVTARTWQDPDGRLRVQLAAGGGGYLTDCPRPWRTIYDGEVGPAEVPCNGGRVQGWYSYRYDCYFNAEPTVAQRKDPSDPDVIYPDGVEPGDDGAVHTGFCFLRHYTEEGGWRDFEFWFLPPGEAGPTPDRTAEVIVDALDNLALYPATIGTGPPAREGTFGLVGLPVWLWNDADARNWGTRTAEADAGGVTATAEATAEEIVWDMGDGDHQECNQGVAFTPDLDWRSPPCGHRYDRASRDQPDGRYQITATTLWRVTWEVTGPTTATGTVILRPQASVSLEIRELQVLIGR